MIYDYDSWLCAWSYRSCVFGWLFILWLCRNDMDSLFIGTLTLSAINHSLQRDPINNWRINTLRHHHKMSPSWRLRWRTALRFPELAFLWERAFKRSLWNESQREKLRKERKIEKKKEKIKSKNWNDEIQCGSKVIDEKWKVNKHCWSLRNIIPMS